MPHFRSRLRRMQATALPLVQVSSDLVSAPLWATHSHRKRYMSLRLRRSITRHLLLYISRPRRFMWAQSTTSGIPTETIAANKLHGCVAHKFAANRLLLGVIVVANAAERHWLRHLLALLLVHWYLFDGGRWCFFRYRPFRSEYGCVTGLPPGERNCMRLCSNA